ncbi:MAG TPA: aspartate--tRNA ligase [Gemmatimonadaceae bacterium]|nr:aspartate--tRNA ligase [Gemmatimonadaceae bacterium]
MSQRSPFKTALRDTLCGSLRLDHVGTHVRLGGWVHRRRDLGGLVFIDLRDRAGIVQVSFDPAIASPETLDAARSLGSESVVLVTGDVTARPQEMRNADLETGDIEIKGHTLQVVGPAETPVIPVARNRGEPLPAEELRLRHRHLDLRRPELRDNIVLRHHLMQATRGFLSEEGFVEIETPILTKPTPEGARDYLVPSRVHAGEFYALPQSPQLYKQLLMVSGFDRYFQIARCFRDEDLRADRQPEFTQIDIEASFVTREDIMSVGEGLVRALWAVGGHEIPAPFRRMTYADSMERYGCDRPDLRYGLEIVDRTDVFAASELTFVRQVIDAGGRVRGIRIPGGASLSRKQTDELEAVAKSAGAGGLIALKRTAAGLEGKGAKFLPEGSADRLALAEGDLGVFVAAQDAVSSPALDRVRQDLARRLGLIPSGTLEFLWVVDFPMFDRDPATGGVTPVHHPFTAVHPDDGDLLATDPTKARALAYDVVLNGTELGGGSIRISNPAEQSRVFSLLGIDEETAKGRFGFLLDGLRAGAPPHGGIAFGFDRVAMLLAGATSLRDVIAFPKTTAARALFEGAPTTVPSQDLGDLHIAIVGD